MTDEKGKSCVALLSGGLDSMLAAALMKRQGIEVYGLGIIIGFGPIPRKGIAPEHPAIKSAQTIGISVETCDISSEYIQILLNPRYGYGGAANPCIDCHIEMLKRAKIHMEQNGASFIVTGEVRGQRPMSQNMQQLELIAKRAGVEDILLRPLSAKLLEPTLPEREGWVDRERLFDIGGRGRSTQLRLAAEMGIKEYQQPAGGCLLADKLFGKKFFDLVDAKGAQNVNIIDLRLLKTGRHFRIGKNLKVIIGRDEDENIFLEQAASPDMGFMQAVSHNGPIAVIDGEPGGDEQRLIAAMVARYGQGRNEPVLQVIFRQGVYEKIIEVAPMKSNEPERWKI